MEQQSFLELILSLEEAGLLPFVLRGMEEWDNSNEVILSNDQILSVAKKIEEVLPHIQFESQNIDAEWMSVPKDTARFLANRTIKEVIDRYTQP